MIRLILIAGAVVLALRGRDCGRVNARELAACLGVEVETPENY